MTRGLGEETQLELEFPGQKKVGGVQSHTRKQGLKALNPGNHRGDPVHVSVVLVELIKELEATQK